MIKPHPRNHSSKLEKIHTLLSDKYEDIILLNDPALKLIPFEALFQYLFLDRKMHTVNEVRVLSFSTTCLPLAYLYRVRSIIGFGPDLVARYFHKPFIAPRQVHEEKLTGAMERLLELAEGNEIPISTNQGDCSGE